MAAKDGNGPKEARRRSKYRFLLEAVFIVLAVAIVVGTPVALYAKESSTASSHNPDPVFNILARNDAVDHTGRWLVQKGSSWDYNDLSLPSVINVEQGDTVTLHITSFDETHGFELDAYGINEPVYAGKFTDITFVASKAGKFPFECSIYCGEGHSDMTGELIVQPRS